MTTDIDLRAGDADREATADRLRQSHSEGRIDSEEFSTRIDRCYDAKTMRELSQLTADLPQERRTGFSLGPPRAGLLLPAAVAALAAVAVAATVAHGGFGLVFPLLFMARFGLWRRWPRSARHRV